MCGIDSEGALGYLDPLISRYLLVSLLMIEKEFRSRVNLMLIIILKTTIKFALTSSNFLTKVMKCK